MYKFKLNVAVRLILLMHLPEQGSVLEMISKRNIRNKIDFSSKELEDNNIKNENGRITWSMYAPEIEVEFTEGEIKFLKTIIDKLDKSGLITDNILDFVEKIIKLTNGRSNI